ncbi:hypothetical protein E3P77_02307 [Wallemia ichthyophaga]|nr:hypothetical protein E3P77_02307 [Wallemia ichthyophaga]
MILSIPRLWQRVEIYERDLSEGGMRSEFAEFIKLIRSRNKKKIKEVKLLLGATQVPGVAIRTLIGAQKLDKLVVHYTETFNGPFFVPPECTVVEAWAATLNTHNKPHALIIQKNQLDVVRLHNVLPWSTHFDQDLSNGVRHLHLHLNTQCRDTMAGYTISQCKDLETLYVGNLAFTLNIPISLAQLKILTLVNSSSALRFLRAPALEEMEIYTDDSVDMEESITIHHSLTSLRRIKLRIGREEVRMNREMFNRLEVADVVAEGDGFLDALVSNGRGLRVLRTRHADYSKLRNLIERSGLNIEELTLEETPAREKREDDKKAIDCCFNKWEDVRLKWVDDTTALVIFTDPVSAKRAYLHVVAHPPAILVTNREDKAKLRISPYNKQDSEQIITQVYSRHQPRRQSQSHSHSRTPSLSHGIGLAGGPVAQPPAAHPSTNTQHRRPSNAPYSLESNHQFGLPPLQQQQSLHTLINSSFSLPKPEEFGVPGISNVDTFKPPPSTSNAIPITSPEEPLDPTSEPFVPHPQPH